MQRALAKQVVADGQCDSGGGLTVVVVVVESRQGQTETKRLECRRDL